MSETVPPPSAPEASDVSVFTTRGMRELHKATDIRGHDFRQSGFLAASEMRRIRQRHEQFIRSLAARVAMFLRLEFSLQLSKVQIVAYQKFTESLSNPAHVTLFKSDPLKGVGLLAVSPRLGLTFVDRLLGGPGSGPEESRELTEIEVALFDQVAMLILGEWCTHWPEIRDLRPTLLGHESSGNFLQTATPDTAMLVISMTGGIGDQSEPFHLAFPYTTVEPLMRLLVPAMPGIEPAPAPAPRLKWKSEFDDVQVPVVAEWHGLKMSAGEIMHLKVGDLIALDPACAAQVQIRLNHVAKFTGRPGTSAGKWAVQLTGDVKPLKS